MEAVHDLEHVFPSFAFDVVGIGAEEIGRMVGRQDRDATVFAPFAAKFGDADAGDFAEESIDGGGSESDDRLGLDKINLCMEVRKAAFHFFRCGRTVAVGLAGGVRAAFENVRDVNLFARESHGLNDLCEKLAGATNEGFSLFVFLSSRSFTDKHEFGIDAADAKDHVFAGSNEVRAFLANQRTLAEFVEGSEFVSAFGEDDGLGERRGRRRGRLWCGW